MKARRLRLKIALMVAVVGGLLWATAAVVNAGWFFNARLDATQLPLPIQ